MSRIVVESQHEGRPDSGPPPQPRRGQKESILWPPGLTPEKRTGYFACGSFLSAHL